jgi:hypothetical protein
MIARIAFVFESPDPVYPGSLALRTFLERLKDPMLPEILFGFLFTRGILCEVYKVHPSGHPSLVYSCGLY